MSTSFRKNIFTSLAVLVFSLVASSYVVFNQGEKALAQQPLDLVSRWNGDAVSEGTASDVQGGNNGTILGGVTIVPGKAWRAFKFDGSSGHIDMGNPADLNFGTTGAFSLEAWFNWDGEGDHVNIIRKSNYSGSPAGYWLRILSPLASGLDGNTLEFFTGDTVGTGQPSGRVTTPINPKTWYHVVATRDSAGTMKLYVDDELKGTAEAPNADTTSDSEFALGFWPDQNSEFFSGMIEAVSVYASAIDSQEVKSAYVDDPNKVEKLAAIKKQAEPFIKDGQSPGQCQSFDECQAYCNIEKNFSECTKFEKKADIVQEAPQEQQVVFAAMQKGEGPGQCKDEVSCRKYCEDIDHIEECVGFVERFNLESPDNLKEMRKVSDAKTAGVAFPGNCKTKEGCMKYCEGPTHQVECMEFGLKTGLVPKEDVEAINKIIPYLKSGGKLPGGCTSKESCDTYCESDANTNECVDFAVSAGFVTKEEADVVKKVGGKGPGNCKSREKCDSYCKDEAHVDECTDFAVKAGFISQEDAEMAKKFKITSGPGGCKSKTECQSFCTVPANQETCMSWAKEHGMDTSGGGPGGPGGAGFSGPGGCKNKEECTTYCMANQKDEACKKMMEQFGGQNGSGEQGGNIQPSGGSGGGGFSGPGGCKNQEECMVYCRDHQEECKNFSPPGGSGGSGGNGEQIQPSSNSGAPTNSPGPGGCKSPEECKTYCMANLQDPGCNSPQIPPPSSPQTPSSSGQIPQEYCSPFASVPSCSYVGAPDSQNYKYCKQCFPDK